MENGNSEQQHCQYFCLASGYPLSTQVVLFGCNQPGASRWSPVFQQVAGLKMGEEIMNEAQLKVSLYKLVSGSGCWRRQLDISRSSQTQEKQMA